MEIKKTIAKCYGSFESLLREANYISSVSTILAKISP